MLRPTSESPEYIAIDVTYSGENSPSKSRSSLYSLVKGIAKAIGIAAVFSFLIGGRAIHEITHADRMLAEMEGIGLAAVLGLVAAVVNGAAERIDDSGEPVSLTLGAGSDKNKSE